VERRYYACRIRRHASEFLVVWFMSDRDGFLRLPDGRLLTEVSWEALTTRMEAMGISLASEDPTDYDFDLIGIWCQRPTKEGITCSAFLNGWNFFDDLAGLHTAPTTDYARLSRAASGCYDKLFWGNNLPSVTPPGQRFDPPWSYDELAAIRQVFEAGLNMVEKELSTSEHPLSGPGT
jgi:hypothetical protein